MGSVGCQGEGQGLALNGLWGEGTRWPIGMADIPSVPSRETGLTLKPLSFSSPLFLPQYYYFFLLPLSHITFSVLQLMAAEGNFPMGCMNEHFSRPKVCSSPGKLEAYRHRALTLSLCTGEVAITCIGFTY